MRSHGSLRVLGPVIFSCAQWSSLAQPLQVWCGRLAEQLKEAFTRVLSDVDPRSAWKAHVRGDGGAEDQKALEGFQQCLSDCGADEAAAQALDRLLFYPLKKAVQVYVEGFVDPEHVFSVGGMLAVWGL